MSEIRYVKHMSGQGELWKVTEHDDNLWRAYDPAGRHDCHAYLPKSEYMLCRPPEVWRDVTDACEIFSDGFDEQSFTGISHERVSRFQTTRFADGYRLRKVQLHNLKSEIEMVGQDFRYKTGWAFIVEKREP